jgi:hypothetical protein
VTLDDVRTAAIDRALVGSDPVPALALAGVADRVDRRSTDDRISAGDPVVASLLAVGAVVAAGEPSLDGRAWRPGATDVDPLVVAGAAAAVRRRGVAVVEAADLAGCTTAAIEAMIERQHRRQRER